MAVSGQIGNFDPQVEEWTEYVERLDLFMEANSVWAKAKNRAVFLTFIGPSVYKLLRNLLAPDKPADMEYETLQETVKQYYNPRPSEIIHAVVMKINCWAEHFEEVVKCQVDIDVVPLKDLPIVSPLDTPSDTSLSDEDLSTPLSEEEIQTAISAVEIQEGTWSEWNHLEDAYFGWG